MTLAVQGSGAKADGGDGRHQGPVSTLLRTACRNVIVLSKLYHVVCKRTLGVDSVKTIISYRSRG